MNDKLVRGKIVKVYEDPFTCAVLEGNAKLIKHLQDLDNDVMERWEVEFPLENRTFERWINKRDH